LRFCIIVYRVNGPQRSSLMSNKSYEQKYTEQTKICDENIAIIQPFLKEFGQKHDAGTGFYEDVTVLAGPGDAEYNHFRDERKDVFDRWQKGETSIYNIRWSGLTFIIEYKFDRNVIYENKGQKIMRPIYVPSKSMMVYKHQEQPVSLKIALAVQNLFSAQEYRSALYACMRDSNINVQ